MAGVTPQVAEGPGPESTSLTYAKLALKRSASSWPRVALALSTEGDRRHRVHMGVCLGVYVCKRMSPRRPAKAETQGAHPPAMPQLSLGDVTACSHTRLGRPHGMTELCRNLPTDLWHAQTSSKDP